MDGAIVGGIFAIIAAVVGALIAAYATIKAAKMSSHSSRYDDNQGSKVHKQAYERVPRLDKSNADSSYISNVLFILKLLFKMLFLLFFALLVWFISFVVTATLVNAVGFPPPPTSTVSATLVFLVPSVVVLFVFGGALLLPHIRSMRDDT